ncbi:unnamed protein product [Rangifer tarandus platyrhynchus]|uniref:Uncharacterized protein n=1 Tax=Rangifer tarandus platyrhynchus TaxID=3082113 RepID=A0AC59Y418_RANTA
MEPAGARVSLHSARPPGAGWLLSVRPSTPSERHDPGPPPDPDTKMHSVDTAGPGTGSHLLPNTLAASRPQ